MTREEAIGWLQVINTKKFGWDEFALQESQREIRERCEQGVREAIDMAIEALSSAEVQAKCIAEIKVDAEDIYTRITGLVADKVDVVRCKDCQHGWYDDDIEYYVCRHPKGLNEELYGVDYCSYGQTKEQTEYKLHGHDEVMEALDKLTLRGDKDE